MKFLWVGIGGFLGAIARYLVATWCVDRLHSRFPFGTFLINISGCLLIGMVVTILDAHATLSSAWRYAVPIGFIGAYTTFSTFELETFRAVHAGWMGIGIVYVLLSLFLGYIAVWAGLALGRLLV